QLPAEFFLPRYRRAVYLKHRLCQIYANHRIFRHGCRPFRSVAFNTTFLAHCDAVREGGNHPISLIEPEDNCCGDTDGREECVSAAVIPCMDASPVLEFCEHVLNLVALAIKPCVMRNGCLAVG